MSMSPIAESVKSAAMAFLPFLNQSVTPFHAVASCEEILKKAGFVQRLENEEFAAKSLDKFYVKKNESSIYAFAVGGAYQQHSGGFSMVVAHIDSPCLRVKPVSKKTSEQSLQIGVSPYGGGLWRTWFDRDLCVAGQVVYQRGGEIVNRLVNVNRPIMMHIPSTTDKETVKLDEDLAKVANSVLKEQHDQFLKMIAKHAECKPDEILDMDLCLYDAQPAVLSGLNEEFISGARLDNLVGTYTAVVGLVESLADDFNFKRDPNIRMVACFDNQECGSGSAQGAQFIEWLLRQLVASDGDQNAFEYAIANSCLISCDQAHSVQPNSAQKHEDNHRPSFHGGVVVKINYATTAPITHSVLKMIADSAGVPLQDMVVRNDSSCGSTIGPILSAKLGVRTIDLGCPQLAMHSIRELGDTSSIHQSIALFAEFFEQFPTVGDLPLHPAYTSSSSSTSSTSTHTAVAGGLLRLRTDPDADDVAGRQIAAALRRHHPPPPPAARRNRLPPWLHDAEED